MALSRLGLFLLGVALRGGEAGSAGLLRGVHNQGAAAAETDGLGDGLKEAVASASAIR